MDSYSFEPELTEDGSFTFFSAEFGESFHSKFGAKLESIYKFVIPTLLPEKAQLGQVKILDICYGLGYNTAAAIDYIWQVNPQCTIEIIALESDVNVPQKAIEYNLLKDWSEPIPDLLNILVNKEKIIHKNLDIQLLIGDARQTIQNIIKLGWKADAIFLDPFSPPQCPQLWTIDFLNLVSKCCKKDGIIATYSCAAAVRNALIMVGLAVGSTIPVGRKSPGTIASWESENIPKLSQSEIEYLHTKAGIPYRDPQLNDIREMILERRKIEQDQSHLESTSQWKKRHN